MKKMISLFERTGSEKTATDRVTPGAEWVVVGEGVGTRKWDGTACAVIDGKLYKRFDAKRSKVFPDGFISCQDESDTRDCHTSHWMGWVPVGDGPEDKWHRKAWLSGIVCIPGDMPEPYCETVDGTYELCGPAVNGNNELLANHVLIKHGYNGAGWVEPPRDFLSLVHYLKMTDAEGIVWHHPDGRMVKLKKRDFGLPRR
jgi:hypothetical protein